ncbi:hypothetical protein EDD22DRAFT_962861 [Suillus occidentalis]|nr:hypothetical protein EDD22DRAFT_962861 [Suillus occidentalis]
MEWGQRHSMESFQNPTGRIFVTLLESTKALQSVPLNGPWSARLVISGKKSTCIILQSTLTYLNVPSDAARSMLSRPSFPRSNDQQTALPKGSFDLGEGYILLRRRERTAHVVRPCEAQAIVRFLANNSGIEIPSAPPITKWARLRLPNGQVARSAWKENAMTKQPRMAHNVKLLLDGQTAIGEVYYYFNMTIHDRCRTFSHGLGIQRSTSRSSSSFLSHLCAIQSVVAMVPHQFPGIDGILFYLIERPGLDIITMSGINEEDIPDED